MADSLIQCVSVWYDDVSGPPYEAKWIVSRDWLENGAADSSHTMSVHATEAEAMEEGRRQAQLRVLPLYRQTARGRAVLIEPAPAE